MKTIKMPIYGIATLPEDIVKRCIPFTLENHPVNYRFQRGDKVTYCGKSFIFGGVVAARVASPVCELTAYGLVDADGKWQMVLDINNVRLVGDA